MKSKVGKKFFLIIFLLGFLFSVHAQQLYYPDADWQIKKPEEIKMNSRLLDSAIHFAINNENKVDRDLRIADLKAYANEPFYKIYGPTKQRGGPAGMIIKNGYIVGQWGDINRVDMDFSATKSYLSTVAGIAIDEKLIKNINDKVNQYVWDGTFEGEHNSKITWQHLLTQSSDWYGNLFDIYDWADRPAKDGKLDDWRNRKLFEPGEHFKYNDVRVNLLAYSLLQVWRKPLPVVLKEKIMDPIGASTTWRWYGYENSFVNIDGIMMQSVSGGGHFGGGLFINTIDQARFGLLFLRKGKWKDKQLISENWVNAVHQPSLANKSYGYMWWTNLENKFPNVPLSVYYAEGFGGNYVIVDNAHDLVVVARWLDTDKTGDLINLIIKSIEK
ncbi:MAG: beta-lactamase family protein [Bacteroidota bacterium]|nr:beta-lactamase family protein [Bacteroidota bacterium]